MDADAHSSNGSPGRGRSPLGWLTTAGVLTLVVALSTLGQLGDLLSGMDPKVLAPESLAVRIDPDRVRDVDGLPEECPVVDGRPAQECVDFWTAYVSHPGGVDSLTAITFWSADADQTLETWEVWSLATRAEASVDARSAEPDRPFVTPGRVVFWYVVVDTILLVPSAALLISLAYLAVSRRRARALPDGTPLVSPGDFPAVETFDRLLRWTLSTFVVFGVAENIALFATYASDGGVPGPVVGFLTFVTRLALVGAIGTVVFFGLATRYVLRPRLDHAGRLSRWHPLRRYHDAVGGLPPLGDYWRGAVALRVPILILGFMALFMLGLLPSGIGDQMPDVIRRWTWAHLVVVVGLNLWLAWLVWAFARGVRERNRVQAKRMFDGKGWKAARSVVAWALVGLAVAQLVWYVVAEADTVGLGLVLPGAFVLSMAIFGKLIEKGGRALPSKPARRKDRRIPERWPRLLAAATLVILGLAMFRAALPPLVFESGRFRWYLFLIIGYIVLVLWRTRTTDVENDDDLSLTDWLAAMVVAVPVVLLVLVLFGVDDNTVGPSLLMLIGVAFIYLALPAYHYLEEVEGHPQKSWVSKLLEEKKDSRGGVVLRWSGEAQRVFFALLALTGLAVAILVSVPFGFAEWLGSLGTAMVFVVALAGIIHSATLFVEHTRPPLFLARLGVRRTPVFILLIVWLLAVNSFDVLTADAYHDD